MFKLDLTFILFVIVSFISLLMSVPMIWSVAVGIIGTLKAMLQGKKNKSKKPVNDKKLTFAVVCCARNEECVIANLLESLKAQKYPRNKYDVFVIADNCSDRRTAEVSEAHGAIVYERSNDELIGKGFALQWGFKQIFSDFTGRYDAVAVFDADNTAPDDFLEKMNRELLSGADCAQAMRRSSNPYDTAVSGCYEIYWIVTNRFQNLARNALGLSCLLNGTGFALKAELVKGGAWQTSTLTEDIEFSIREICHGKRIVAVSDTYFYDEQPTTWEVSLKQRFRWAFGGIQCAKQLLSTKCFGAKDLSRAFDAMLLIMFLPSLSLTLPITFISSILALMMPWTSFGMIFAWLVLTFLFSALFEFLMSLVLLKAEGLSLKKTFTAALFFPLFMIPVPYMGFICFFKKNVKWHPIKHIGKTFVR